VGYDQNIYLILPHVIFIYGAIEVYRTEPHTEQELKENMERNLEVTQKELKVDSKLFK
jgi:hypothetical protein